MGREISEMRIAVTRGDAEALAAAIGNTLEKFQPDAYGKLDAGARVGAGNAEGGTIALDCWGFFANPMDPGWSAVLREAIASVRGVRFEARYSCEWDNSCETDDEEYSWDGSVFVGAVLYSDNYGDVEDGEDDDGFWARDFVLELGGVVPAGRVLTGRDGIDFSEESWVLDGDGNWTRSAA